MYFQRDYILRMIEMLGEFLRDVLDMARDADALHELDEVSRKASGLPLTLLKMADVPTLESLLSPEQRYLCAELLLASAQVDARTHPDEETAPTRAQALMLLCTLQSPDYVPLACDRAHTVMEPMLAWLSPQELLALANLFERGGAYAACEDALYALGERSMLAAFYARMLALDDRALCAGNLPREEILESAALLSREA